MMLDLLNQHFDLLGKVITGMAESSPTTPATWSWPFSTPPRDQPDHAMQATQAGSRFNARCAS
jgi:hypothetical protein